MVWVVVPYINAYGAIIQLICMLHVVMLRYTMPFHTAFMDLANFLAARAGTKDFCYKCHEGSV